MARAFATVGRLGAALTGRGGPPLAPLRAPRASPTSRHASSAATSRGAAPRGAGAAPEGREPASASLMEDTKVSSGSSADALFQECINSIRQHRARLETDPVYQEVETGAITKLKQDELELTRKIFARVDPTRNLTSDLRHAGHDIDPYWSPFRKADDLNVQVSAEFDQYARYVSVAEQKRIRIQIKKSLKRCSPTYNPYSSEFRKWHGRQAGQQFPVPFRLADKHWEPSPLQARLASERITWRDVDIIQHCLADNGYILPRRSTMFPLRKQKQLVKAVKRAQKMSLLPYFMKPQDYQAMPLMDPLQWSAERLTDRWIDERDRRSQAVLRVMLERHPELDYRRFLRHEARQADRAEAEGPRAAVPAVRLDINISTG